MRLLHNFDLKCCRAFARWKRRLFANHRKLVFFFEWVRKVKTFFLQAAEAFQRAAHASSEGFDMNISPRGCLLLHGARDRAVHPDNAWKILSRVSSPRREGRLLPLRENVKSGHLLVTHEETSGPW
jgi:hypothetical protein